MKIKPGIIRPASVPSGHARGWTFTLIIEIEKGCEFEVAYCANIPNITHAKQLMRETINRINMDIDDEKKLVEATKNFLGSVRNYGHS